jgi:hypothetical protein
MIELATVSLMRSLGLLWKNSRYEQRALAGTETSQVARALSEVRARCHSFSYSLSPSPEDHCKNRN